MSSDRELVALKNIGKKIASRLEKAGIHDESDLRAVGAVEAHRRIRALFPHETLPVCYYLYAFEGALTDTHWDAIGDERKQALRAQIMPGKS